MNVEQPAGLLKTISVDMNQTRICNALPDRKAVQRTASTLARNVEQPAGLLKGIFAAGNGAERFDALPDGKAVQRTASTLVQTASTLAL
jgi:hypothetical protein